MFSPSIQATFWTPAAALSVVVAGVGLPRLVRLASMPGALAAPTARAARAACAFVVIALVSALLASNRTISFFGLYGWGTGWLFVLCLAGAWAIGRSLAARGVALVERALVAAAIVNAVVALAEMALDLTTFQLGKVGGRAMGLLGNPIHLGGFAGAAIVLVGRRFGVRPARWAVAVVLLGAAVQVSGSRTGLAIVVVGTVVAAWHVERRPLGVAFAGLVVAGLVAGAGLAQLGGGTSVSNRLQEAGGGGGVRARTLTWEAGVRSVADHPLVGIGPGLFRDAAAPRRTAEIARAESADKLFVDAHNIVVEYLTTTGVLGVVALLAWVVFAARGCRGPMWWFALLLAVNHLLEPQNVRTTPVLFLAFGAAAAAARVGAAVDGAQPVRRVRADTVITTATTAVAVLAAVTLLVGDFRMEQGRLDFVHGQAHSALRLLPRWPEPAVLEARIYLFDERVNRDRADFEAGLRWLRIAGERDRGDPDPWDTLGENLLVDGQLARARAAFTTALRANPTATRTLNGLAHVALAAGDERGARRWFLRSLVMDPDQRAVRRRLDALRGGP